MTTIESLDSVSEQLMSGQFREAERLLTQLILEYVGRPDAPSLFRIFQASPDFSLVARLDEFRDAVHGRDDTILKSCFDTLVGPLATDQLGAGSNNNEYVKLSDHVDSASKVCLFEDQSNELLWINLTSPISTCNYRCAYCFLVEHDKKPDLKKIELLPLIIDRLARIPRPISVTLGPTGDILAVPAMWPLFTNLANLPNLQHVEIWTNLYRGLDGISERFPLERLAIIATYHPSQFSAPEFEEKSEAFFERVAFLRDNAHDISVNFVTSIVNMPNFETVRQRLKEMGVYFTVNPLQGTLNGDGKQYPEAYSQKDWLRIQKWTQNDLYAFFAGNRKAKVRCSAGADHIDIRFDGNVSRCEHQAYQTSPQGYGNIFDDGGPLIDKVNRYCWMDGCACKSTIGYAEPVIAEFKRQGTQHHFIRRAAGDKGAHSYSRASGNDG